MSTLFAWFSVEVQTEAPATIISQRTMEFVGSTTALCYAMKLSGAAGRVT
jgi:hypothetical protein